MLGSSDSEALWGQPWRRSYRIVQARHGSSAEQGPGPLADAQRLQFLLRRLVGYYNQCKSNE